jgi:glycosyltransferase involved in cell wall biosynthesis
MQSNAYVLMTAARNEERHIRKTLQSVVDQTQLPKRWLVVSDGSTDLTDQYVRDFAGRYSFIRLLRLDNAGERSFSSKSFALNAGYAEIRDVEYDFIGILDADVSLPPNYYEQLLAKFDMQPRLGVAGGVIVEARRGEWQRRYSDSIDDVAGAIQFFRRKCYEDTGGFMPLKWGGEDAAANAIARQKRWQVRTFTQLRAYHHRPTGTAGASVRGARFREGAQDYFLGYHPLFELGKCLRRLLEPPYFTGSLLRLCGYCWPRIQGEPPTAPAEFVRDLRQQQMRRLLRRTGS